MRCCSLPSTVLSSFYVFKHFIFFCFLKNYVGLDHVSVDAISLQRMQDTVEIVEHESEDEKNTELEDSLFLWARSPDRLLHEDTCLAFASTFVILRLFFLLLPKLNACVKQAWRMRFHELKRLFPSLS
jgi:hypothetical protein